MHFSPILPYALAAAGLASAASANYGRLPSLRVPQCPSKGTVRFDKSVPDKKDFPRTEVDLCWTPTTLHLDFKAFDETNFYFNGSQTTNGDIWEYEVMEAFIYYGENDPQTYLEFEVNPNNVTYQAFVYNPTKVRATGAPFDHFFVSDPATDGFSAQTTLDQKAKTWFSQVQIPIALFNVPDGRLRGSKWRMNFFRTTTSPATYPDQGLGAWNPPNQASFHMTPFFGRVDFV